MAEYNVAQLINKTLFAKTKVAVYRSAYDAAPPVYYVSAGQPIGKVYSWLDPKENRKHLYFVFYDSKQRPYYVRNIAGTLSPEKIVPTTEDEQKKAKDENTGILDGIEDSIKDGVGNATDGLTGMFNKLTKGLMFFGAGLLALKVFDRANGTSYADLSDFKKDFAAWKAAQNK